MTELRATALLSLAGALAGVALGAPAQPVIGLDVVDAALAAPVQLREITAPVALLLAGGMAGRLLASLTRELKGWKPHVIVEHRHVDVRRPPDLEEN
jgi:hypothetical protein